MDQQNRNEVDRHAATGVRRAHLVGIGGAGMRALADVLLGQGWELTGSDLNIESAQYLAAQGVRLSQAHRAENLRPDVEQVVFSSAIRVDNPELRRAAELRIPACSYAELAGRIMATGRGLAIAGTHGKSTCTAMAAHLFQSAGRDPTVLCGATPLGRASGGRAGRGEDVLVEACEYRANFLHLAPRQAIILGIEPDHFDYYKSQAQLEDAFGRFARSVPSGGLLLSRFDCPAAQRAARSGSCHNVTFGPDPRADWSIGREAVYRGCYAFEILRDGRHVCHTSLRVPGRHNMLNALAAAALAGENGISSERISRSLASFQGLHRRLETRGTWQGILMVDDYAHHPTEVAAGLATIRQMAPGRRVWCVFQPHQVSRTEHLLEELAASLHDADKVFVAEVFRAREEDPPAAGFSRSSARPRGATAADLAREARRLGVDVLPNHHADGILRLLQTRLVAGDVLVTMGAGDVFRIGDQVVQSFQRRTAAA